MTEKQRVEKFAKKFNDKDVRIRYVLGAFGDMQDCVGIVEEEIFPKEGGAFIKYLGCSYLQKGCPLGVIPMELIECYGFAKRILARGLLDTIKDRTLMFFILFYWTFKKRRFYELLNKYVNDIHDKTVGVLKFDEKRYNKFPKELIRALRETFKKELGVDVKTISREEVLKDKKLRFYIPLYKLLEVLIFLVDFDTAYKLPGQDVLSELNKQNNPVKELERLVDILIERTQPGSYVEKLESIKKLIKLLRYFPLARRMLKNFFDELNLDEIKMDEADWYWCLRRKLHNFKGVSLEERLEQVKKIDEEKGHVKIKFNIAFSEEDFYKKLGVDKPKEKA